MTDTNNSKDLAVGLEVFPRAGRISTEYELEAEATGVPRLMSKGGLLMLSIEGTDGREWNQFVPQKHRQVVPELRRRNRTDRQHRHPDHGAGFHANVGLHVRDLEMGNARRRRIQLVESHHELELMK